MTEPTTAPDATPRASSSRGDDGRRPTMVVVGVGLIIVAMVAAAAIAYTVTAESSPTSDPIRVLLIGDSIMNQAGGYVEAALEADDGIDDVVVLNEGVNGSGLLTPQLYDWQHAPAELIADFEPDMIVVLFVGNYTSEDLYENIAGLEVEGYTDQFFDAWEREARDLQRDLLTADADLFWVNPPPMISDEGERRITEFRRIQRGIAEDWTGVVLIDGTAALSDENGNYALELPNEEGLQEQVRTADSVHLTQYGSRVLADEIARQLTPSVKIAQRSGEGG